MAVKGCSRSSSEALLRRRHGVPWSILAWQPRIGGSTSSIRCWSRPARAAAQASLATAGGSPLVVMGASQTTEHRRSYSASVASFSTNESSDAFCAAGARSIASSRP